MSSKKKGRRKAPFLSQYGLSIVVVMTAVAALELAADFAGPEGRGVHVGVDPAGADRADDFIELPGVDSLAGGGEHLGGDDRPGHGACPGTAAQRCEGGDSCRGRGARRLAEAEQERAD